MKHITGRDIEKMYIELKIEYKEVFDHIKKQKRKLKSYGTK